MGIEQGDWVWIENDNGKIRQVADLYHAAPGTVNLEHQWWFPELNQADKGYDLCGCNCLVTTGKGYQDRISGTSYLRAYLSTSTRQRRRTRRSAIPCRAITTATRSSTTPPTRV